MIVTLAGHVDHGKSTLVRLLTGKETDRLAEEQARGLTIDLGFAYLAAGPKTLGFVDVPGHHRFIHNMVAGVAALQHALLVVAADDGPMPQSREHLQILELIGLEQGTVALTKCDRVSPDRLAAARRDVAALVSGTFLDGAPLVETAAANGTAIDRLKAMLFERAVEPPAPLTRRPFRMALDRAFHLKGTGLVVTGTVHGGEVGLEDEVHLFPTGRAARVRGLHVQNQPAERARAGDRAAVNLAGVDGHPPERGEWLCSRPEPGHRSVVVEMRLLDDVPAVLRHWTPVHVYHATSHTTAHLALLEGNRLAPGQRALAELVLDAPLLAKRGDRLIVRDHGLERTLGGGAVIDNHPPRGRRRAPERLKRVRACAATSPGASLDALLALGPVQLEAYRALWDLSPEELETLVAGAAVTRRGDQLVAEVQWRSWSRGLLDECRRRHQADPTLAGLRENDFRAPVPAGFRASLLRELTSAGELMQRAGRYRPTRHQAALSAAERDLLDRLIPLLDQPQPPSLGDMARTLRIPLPRLQQAVKALAGKGMVVLISDKRLYLPRQVTHLADKALELSRRQPFTARDYRDATGIGRNIVIDVLEYFDDRGFTRRSGDARTVVGDVSRLFPV